MASKTINITDVTRGNDITLKFSITTSAALTSARFVAKKKAKDLDSAAIVNKFVTTTLTADGQITNPSANLWVVAVFLTKTESDNFKAGTDYEFDLEVFDAATKATTPAGGKITFEERVRTAIG